MGRRNEQLTVQADDVVSRHRRAAGKPCHLPGGQLVRAQRRDIKPAGIPGSALAVRDGDDLARLGPRKPASDRPTRPLDQAGTHRFEGDWHPAAMLLGVASLARQDWTTWEELEACYRRESLDQVRGHLGQEQFEQVHAEGIALRFGKAVDLASRKASRPDLLV